MAGEITFGAGGNLILSVYNHLRTNLLASGIGSGGVSGTFIQGHMDHDQIKRVRFPDEFINETATDQKHTGMPVITFDDAPLQFSPIQLGSRANRLDQRFLISIYAISSLQRSKIANQIIFNINDKSVTKFNYDSDFDNPIDEGTLWVDPNIRIFPIHTSSEEQENERVFRHRLDISFVVSNR